MSFENNLKNEISRRRAHAWRNFWLLRETCKSKMTLKVKRKRLESCTLPILTNGFQTWATTEAQNLQLKRTQVAMEHSLAGIKQKDKIKNTYTVYLENCCSPERRAYKILIFHFHFSFLCIPRISL